MNDTIGGGSSEGLPLSWRVSKRYGRTICQCVSRRPSSTYYSARTIGARHRCPVSPWWTYRTTRSGGNVSWYHTYVYGLYKLACKWNLSSTHQLKLHQHERPFLWTFLWHWAFLRRGFLWSPRFNQRQQGTSPYWSWRRRRCPAISQASVRT